MQYVDLRKVDLLTLTIYYINGEMDSYIYEDHGDTFAYEQEIYLEKKFVVKGDKNNLWINQNVSGLFTERYETYKLYFIGLPFNIGQIMVDDKEVSVEIDTDGSPFVQVNKDFRNVFVS